MLSIDDNLFADLGKETIQFFIKLVVFFRLLIFGWGKAGKWRRSFGFFVGIWVKHCLLIINTKIIKMNLGSSQY